MGWNEKMVALLNDLAENRRQFFRLCEQLEKAAGYTIDDRMLEVALDCTEQIGFTTNEGTDLMEAVRAGWNARASKRGNNGSGTRAADDLGGRD